MKRIGWSTAKVPRRISPKARVSAKVVSQYRLPVQVPCRRSSGRHCPTAEVLFLAGPPKIRYSCPSPEPPPTMNDSQWARDRILVIQHLAGLSGTDRQHSLRT